MRNLRPALLALLVVALAGLGVPAGFGQSKKSSTTTGKKKPAASNKSHGVKSAASKTGKNGKRVRKQPGQKAPTNDRVSEIQSALAKDGSLTGTPSGKWDDDTADAMRRFQASHGLNPSGKLDARTLQKLGLGSQTAGVAAPTPPPGATSRLTSSNGNPSGSADSPRRQ
jgi:peptidoglycan hydrolase-like protein with peptidoglycan-binding domain